MHMLDNKTREALEKLIGVVVAFLPLILSYEQARRIFKFGMNQIIDVAWSTGWL